MVKASDWEFEISGSWGSIPSKFYSHSGLLKNQQLLIRRKSIIVTPRVPMVDTAQDIES